MHRSATRSKSSNYARPPARHKPWLAALLYARACCHRSLLRATPAAAPTPWESHPHEHGSPRAVHKGLHSRPPIQELGLKAPLRPLANDVHDLEKQCLFHRVGLAGQIITKLELAAAKLSILLDYYSVLCHRCKGVPTLHECTTVLKYIFRRNHCAEAPQPTTVTQTKPNALLFKPKVPITVPRCARVVHAIPFASRL